MKRFWKEITYWGLHAALKFNEKFKKTVVRYQEINRTDRLIRKLLEKNSSKNH